jgi:uncharacterized protein (DUF305 family)
MHRMKPPSLRRRIAAAAVLAAAMTTSAACRSAARRTTPVPPPAGPTVLGPAATVSSIVHAGDQQQSQQQQSAPPPTGTDVAADVHFMQGMIHHHAQALEMVALMPSRTTREDMRLLGQRIDVSQRDEIKLMRQWLLAHHEAAPDPEAHQMMHHDMMPHDSAMAGGGHAMAMGGMDMPAMPGMLTPEQMAQLAQASGTAFDRLFLRDMIHHHEGALKMVADLFATPGAGQDPEVFRFASDVEADQRAEIARMQALLAQLPKE